METLELKAQPDQAESTQSTPRRKVDSKPVPTDSLVTIPLSDASQSRPPTVNIDDGRVDTPRSSVSPTEDQRSSRSSEGSIDDKRSTTSEPDQPNLAEEIENSPEKKLSLLIDVTRRRSGSTTSEASIQVDWEQLDKTEAREEEEADDEEAVRNSTSNSSKYTMKLTHPSSKPLCSSHALNKKTMLWLQTLKPPEPV